jgi:hypothetical protein
MGTRTRRQFVRDATVAGAAAATGPLDALGLDAPRRPRGRHRAGDRSRIGCLYNGYILTVNPFTALDPASSDDRYRLYVLHAVLIHPDTGRVIGVLPHLPGGPVTTGAVARPADEYQQLADSEQPVAPGHTRLEVERAWRAQGLADDLLERIEWLDLEGAVATPGLIDAHFHVSSWSKKLPPPGERFGPWADVSDPRFVLENLERVCTAEALWRIVVEANLHLAETGSDSVFLHGFVYGEVDDSTTDPAHRAHLFVLGTGPDGGRPNPAYILNHVERGSDAALQVPEDACISDPASWPALGTEPAPSLLVHTSGQSCWFNEALRQRFNADHGARADAFPAAALTAIEAPVDDQTEWTLTVAGGQGSHPELFAQDLPFSVDVVISTPGDPLRAHIPFKVTEVDPTTGLMTARAMLPEVAETELPAPAAELEIVPFYRVIVATIPDEDWEQAARYAGDSPTSDVLAQGSWDPRRPHATNWYNGAERGLVEYVHDVDAGVWRASGYAEHYVMRDALSVQILDLVTVEGGMSQRRPVAEWCQRHGITMVNDIMFLRRESNPTEFEACWGLSYDHRLDPAGGFHAATGLHPATTTGDYGLRVGLYYYIETAAEVSRILALAHSEESGYDVERLQAPAGHPEHPGWYRWLGFKLQLDGGPGARTLFTNAPLAKGRVQDPYTFVEEHGQQLTLMDHTFGLLTMTNEQEQVFTSRESAALYWLVREGNPGSAHHNPAVADDWTWLARGVALWPQVELDEVALRNDLAALEHVELVTSADPDHDQPTILAAKIAAVKEQAASGWERVLTAIAKIWWERTQTPAGGPELPAQTVCHCVGDAAGDLFASAIQQLKIDLQQLPDRWSDLPSHWQAVLPEDADIASLRRRFTAERFRVEHLNNVSGLFFDTVVGPGGIDAGTSPAERNVVVSSQPALQALDGERARTGLFRNRQELWTIPEGDQTELWLGVPPRPRAEHHIPCPVFLEHDVPFTINTDPPSVRDPRPALTLIGAVARTPVEIDPSHWVGQVGDEPDYRPPDYLVGKVYAPLGLTDTTPDNPLRLTVEQSLASMTYWGAYAARMEAEVGAIAAAADDPQSRGWFADLVVWAANPLALRGPTGWTLEDLGQIEPGTDDNARLETVNAFIERFRPALTLVGGVIRYRA